MNSGGIGLLVTLLVRAQRGGVRLLASGLSEHYREILSLTRLDEAIEIHERRRRRPSRPWRCDMTTDREDAATDRAPRVPRRGQLGEAGRSALGGGRRGRQGRQRHRQARVRAAPGVRPALAEDLPRPARGLVDEPAGGHRGLEGTVRDVLAEGRPVLRAAGRDRAGRGRAARHRPGARLAGQALDRRHGPLRGRRIVHVHHPGRPYAVGMDHLLGLSRRGRDGRPGPGPRADVRPVRRAGPTCSAATG